MSDLIDREMSHWPGVTWARSGGGKHGRLILRYAGRSRFVVEASTSSDWRAARNKIRDIRAALVALGAWREKRRKSEHQRERNRPERNPLDHVEFAPVKPDPWAKLKEIAMSRTIIINGQAFTFDTGKEIPQRITPGGRTKSDFRLVLEAMRPGESFFVSFDAKTMSSKSKTIYPVSKVTGHRYCFRREGDGYRLFCIEREKVAAPQQGARVLEWA